MARVIWDPVGSRFYETGVDRAVLYADGETAVPWSGLTSVTEHPSGGSQRAYYLDGEKYLNVSSREVYESTITAYTYPKEFSKCNGSNAVRAGLYLTNQSRTSFGLTYRTLVGDDLNGSNGAYKIHLVYGALASPSQTAYKSLGGSSDPSDFSWDITTKPPLTPGYRRTSHVVIDTRYASSFVVSSIEDILYGTVSSSPRLPLLSEVLSIFDSGAEFLVTDNGDGSFTVVGPDSAITMLDSTTFQIVWPSAVFIDAISYTLSS
jgi:hypothetical protein